VLRTPGYKQATDFARNRVTLVSAWVLLREDAVELIHIRFHFSRNLGFSGRSPSKLIGSSSSSIPLANSNILTSECFNLADMCLLPQTSFVIPEQTQRVARAAFPNGSLCIRIADELGSIFRDEQFAELFPRRGQPAEAPARLALVTLLQFGENLSDRQAADAVRGRTDWKYALGLELGDPGFDSTVLSEFSERAWCKALPSRCSSMRSCGSARLRNCSPPELAREPIPRMSWARFVR